MQTHEPANGSSIVIKGELTAAEDLVFHGRVEGTVSLPGQTLTIGAQAHVDAIVEAKDVIVHGFVIGSITASNRLEIAATARMNGDLVSPKIAMAEGAEFSGKVDMPTGSKRAQKAEPRLAATA